MWFFFLCISRLGSSSVVRRGDFSPGKGGGVDLLVFLLGGFMAGGASFFLFLDESVGSEGKAAVVGSLAGRTFTRGEVYLPCL